MKFSIYPEIQLSLTVASSFLRVRSLTVFMTIIKNANGKNEEKKIHNEKEKINYKKHQPKTIPLPNFNK